MKNPKTRKVIFIDRDGVINEDPIGDYVKRWEDFRFIQGAVESLKKLSQSEFEIIIVSNQAGIGDGVYPETALKDITNKMLAVLKKNGIRIGGIYYCLHGKEANCNCRKPKIGLFEQAAQDIPFTPSETYFVGDKVSDVQAGERFGLKTLFVLTGHGVSDQSKLSPSKQPEQVFPSLKEAADYIISRERS